MPVCLTALRPSSSPAFVPGPCCWSSAQGTFLPPAHPMQGCRCGSGVCWWFLCCCHGVQEHFKLSEPFWEADEPSSGLPSSFSPTAQALFTVLPLLPASLPSLCSPTQYLMLSTNFPAPRAQCFQGENSRQPVFALRAASNHLEYSKSIFSCCGVLF